MKTNVSSSPSCTSSAISSASSCFSDFLVRALPRFPPDFFVAKAFSDSSSSLANSGSRPFCCSAMSQTLSVLCCFVNGQSACSFATHLEIDEMSEKISLAKKIRETLDRVGGLIARD